MEEFILAQIMTTKELAKYLRLHEITILKNATKGIIPGIRIGSRWRFAKETIDKWVAEGQHGPQVDKKSKTKAISKPGKKQLPKKKK